MAIPDPSAGISSASTSFKPSEKMKTTSTEFVPRGKIVKTEE